MINLVGPQYEPLTPEEVQELWPQAHKGNEKARERLICSTLRSAVAECYKYATKFDVDELISMALEIATECFDKFEPDKGVQFYSYVVLRVRWKIGDMLRQKHVETVYTDDENLLEALGGYTKPTDTDEERHREDRKETIRNYFLSLDGMSPEKLDEIIKHVEERGHAPKDIKMALKGIKPTDGIIKAIYEVIGADTAAKTVATYEAKEMRRKEDEQRKAEREEKKRQREANRITPEQRKERQREYQREYMRDYYRRKRDAARLANEEQHKNDHIEAQIKREDGKATAKELKAIEREIERLKRQIEELKRENEELKRQREEADKAVVLQRFLDPYKERRRKAVANFNTLYGFIITYTDATPMQAEAAAYMTLQGFGTLRDWSDRHGLVYESVKRWRIQVKKKLAALEDVDADIIALDRSLFKS